MSHARSARVDTSERTDQSFGTGRLPTATILLALITVLCILGMVMVGSASEVVSMETYGSTWAILLRECLWMAVGVVALVFAARFDYHRWRRFSGLLTIGTFALLLVVLVPGIGTHVDGSSRWIGVGPLVIQPSELMKLTMAIAGADLIVRRERLDGGYRTVLVPLLVVAGAGTALILLQPDMGTAVIVAAIALVLVFASGVPMRPIVKLLGAAACLALIVGLADPYRRTRLFSFLNPSAHATGSEYQVVQSLIGFGSGGVFGVGYGNGHQKWTYLPNAHTDFIFSVIGEELGLIGALCTLLLLGALVWFGLRAASRAPDRFGGLLALALVAWIAAETVVNVGAVLGMLPVTGIPLPFISFGGSSLVITMLAAGILVNVAGSERVPRRRDLQGPTKRAGARASTR